MREDRINTVEMLIGGAWGPAGDGAVTPVLNPATGEIIANAAAAGAGDVDRAVAAARQCFADGRWRRLAPADRARILLRAADLIDADGARLARLETRNNGMPLAFAAASAKKAADTFRYFAGWITKIHGQTSEMHAGGQDYLGYTLREPIGVAALITPWNSPLSFAAMKLATALAAGCSAVLKPAEETPLTAIALAEILVKAGLPSGALNVVTGIGEVAGAALASHPDIDKVAFTGSTAVGREIMRAAAGTMKSVTLELGGKSPVIVCADADLARAIPGAAMGIFRNSGQICVAGSRLYVHRNRFDAVVEGVAAIANKMVIGDGLDAATELGPLISRRQLDRVHGMVERAAADGGAELVTGGAARSGGGFFMQPTVLARPRSGSEIMREEVFGPVVTVTPFDELDEAIDASNDSHYGLAAAIWTKDLNTAHRAARAFQAGIVWVNCELVTDLSMPFGGFKQSGVGREQSLEGLDAYLQTKSVYVAL